MSGTGDDRAERAKQALRENLKRRKAQARGQAPAVKRPSDHMPTGGDTKPPQGGSE